jgi:hypothetical protein
MQTNTPSRLLENIAPQLKALNSPDDLVVLGIAGSAKTLANKRSDGSGPDFIRIKGTGIRYPKDAVINWLARSIQ